MDVEEVSSDVWGKLLVIKYKALLITESALGQDHDYPARFERRYEKGDLVIRCIYQPQQGWDGHLPILVLIAYKGQLVVGQRTSDVSFYVPGEWESEFNTTLEYAYLCWQPPSQVSQAANVMTLRLRQWGFY